MDNLFSIGNKEIPFNIATELLTSLYNMGARKLTLLGGEPTLYGSEENIGHTVSDLIFHAKKIGYKYVRMDTNGTTDTLFLDDENMKNIDEISFSIDGFDAHTNDGIRGEGSFNKAVTNIRRAVELGYYIDITCCVYDDYLEKTNNNDRTISGEAEYVLEKFVYFAEELNVKRINFHVLTKDSTPIDAWTGEMVASAQKWVNVYGAITRNIENNKYNIHVRIPKTFVKKEEFDSNPAYYGFCPAKLGERILIHPNGVMRICSNLLSTPYCIADYSDNEIIWNNRKTNELIDHEIDKFTPCTNSQKCLYAKCDDSSKKDFGEYVPLCFSFKPKQYEFVYSDLLNWDDKEKGGLERDV